MWLFSAPNGTLLARACQEIANLGLRRFRKESLDCPSPAKWLIRKRRFAFAHRLMQTSTRDRFALSPATTEFVRCFTNELQNMERSLFLRTSLAILRWSFKRTRPAILRSPLSEKDLCSVGTNRCILSTIGSQAILGNFAHRRKKPGEGETHGFEKTQSQGILKRWRRSGWFGRGSRTVGRRTGPGISLARKRHEQGNHRLW